MMCRKTVDSSTVGTDVTRIFSFIKEFCNICFLKKFRELNIMSLIATFAFSAFLSYFTSIRSKNERLLSQMKTLCNI